MGTLGRDLFHLYFVSRRYLSIFRIDKQSIGNRRRKPEPPEIYLWCCINSKTQRRISENAIIPKSDTKHDVLVVKHMITGDTVYWLGMVERFVCLEVAGALRTIANNSIWISLIYIL